MKMEMDTGIDESKEMRMKRGEGREGKKKRDH
jgi:hypothetical protein